MSGSQIDMENVSQVVRRSNTEVANSQANHDYRSANSGVQSNRSAREE